MKRKKSFFLWLFLLIVLTTYNFDSKENLVSSFFKIKKIEIEGIQNSDRKEIEEKFNPLKEKNIIFTNQKQFRKLIDNLELVKEIKVKKIYPDKIKITIKEFKIIGIFVDEKNQEEYILTDHGKIINNYNKKQFNDLPIVFGKNADKIFFTFYPSLEAAGFEIELIKYFNYFDIKRWDIILKDGKLIKLPSTNYEKSLKKFLSIYETENFKKFRVFDFRVNGQLIIK
ncbi:MAG: FtsQ-type POTRA domain-containing protein [Pelagibacteraceae bacterium]|nr:FtsQ-type POTRA domain-containing protein [Pelagibacteraceae bacterium]